MNTEHVTQETVTKNIHAAAKILSDRSRRTRGEYAQTAEGEYVSSLEAGPQDTLCLVGAIENSAKRYDIRPERIAVANFMGWEATNPGHAWAMLANYWDGASDEEQDAIVAKLLSYPGEPANAP